MAGNSLPKIRARQTKLEFRLRQWKLVVDAKLWRGGFYRRERVKNERVRKHTHRSDGKKVGVGVVT